MSDPTSRTTTRVFRDKAMCPHCGRLWLARQSRLIPEHDDGATMCAGSGQVPRNPESDRRVLWSGKPNPHLSAEQPLPNGVTHD